MYGDEKVIVVHNSLVFVVIVSLSWKISSVMDATCQQETNVFILKMDEDGVDIGFWLMTYCGL